MSTKDLIACSAIQQGRFMSIYGRVLKRTEGEPDFEEKIKLLETNYSDAKKEILKLCAQLKEVTFEHQKAVHESNEKDLELRKLRSENHQLTHSNRTLQTQVQQQQEIAATTEDLQIQLNNAHRQVEALESTRSIELNEHIRQEGIRIEELQQLQQRQQQTQKEKEDLAAHLNQLHQDYTTNTGLLSELRAVNDSLTAELNYQIKTNQQNAELQQEVNQLKTSNTEITTTPNYKSNKKGKVEHLACQKYALQLKNENESLQQSRTTIIAEYRASPELTEEIADEFIKGYQAAVKQIRDAGGDPKTFGFSEDETLDETTGPDEPPSQP